MCDILTSSRGNYLLEDGDKGWVYLSVPKELNVEDAVSVEKCENENEDEDEKKGKRNMALYLVLAAIVLLAIFE